MTVNDPQEREPLPISPPLDAPRAPRGTPRIRLTYKQMLGLPLLAVVPILAMVGVFGNRTKRISVASPSLALTISYPDRMRYRQTVPLRITVQNLTPRTIDTIAVSIDTSYLARFVGVRIDPVAARAYVVPLLDVRSGEARLVSIELTGDRYWRHPALVSATAGDERTTATFSTLVFP